MRLERQWEGGCERVQSSPASLHTEHCAEAEKRDDDGIWLSAGIAGYILQLMQIYNSNHLLSSHTVARHLLCILVLFIFNCSQYLICIQAYKQ